MDAGHWHDRYTRPELAAALDALDDRAPVVRMAAMALRDGLRSDELADGLDDHAHMVAIRWGNYDAHAVLEDAADALRPSEGDDTCETVTGTFRALRSSVIGGVACTEYEEEATHERFVLAGLGRSDQPPELVRVIVTDPDEAGTDDWSAEHE